MAYEYDEFIDAMRFGLTMSDRDTTDDIWKMVDEVVNKAKAWDNYIAEVREHVRFTENTEDDIENETQKVIDYYMEGEWDGSVEGYTWIRRIIPN